MVHAIKTGQEQGMDRKRMYGKVVGKEGLLVKMEMAVSLSKHLKTLEQKEMALVTSGQPLSKGSVDGEHAPPEHS